MTRLVSTWRVPSSESCAFVLRAEAFSVVVLGFQCLHACREPSSTFEPSNTPFRLAWRECIHTSPASCPRVLAWSRPFSAVLASRVSLVVLRSRSPSTFPAPWLVSTLAAHEPSSSYVQTRKRNISVRSVTSAPALSQQSQVCTRSFNKKRTPRTSLASPSVNSRVLLGCPVLLFGVCRLVCPNRQGPSAQEIAALPKWEEQHSTRGKSEGQVQVFQRGGKAIAAQWSAASSTWIEVGEVRREVFFFFSALPSS